MHNYVYRFRVFLDILYSYILQHNYTTIHAFICCENEITVKNEAIHYGIFQDVYIKDPIDDDHKDVPV